MIGDPRDTGERTLNTADTVAEWADRIRGQLERFVEFDDSPTGAVVREQPVVDRRAVGDRVPPRRRQALLGQRHARPRHGPAPSRGRRHLLHRVQLHAVAGQRLRGAAPAVRMHAADRRLRSVGQHHRRGPAGAPEAGRDGARADHAAGDRFRGQEVRQVDRRRQPLAGPGDDQPVRLVPVLRQHRRRRRRSATCGGSPSCRARSWPSWSRRPRSGRTSGRRSAGWPAS